jgi:homoserine dehydrogenase
MYYGRGAGGTPTASAVVSDILSIALGTWPILFESLTIWPDRCPKAALADSGESAHRHYMRFMIRDESGVVAEITSALAKKGISLNAFIQKESHEGELVPVVMTTHEAREQDISEAFEIIRALPSVGPDAVRIRIIDEHAESL